MSPGVDILYDMLSDPYRQQVLSALYDQNPQRDDEFFATEGVDVSDDEVERIRTALYHIHLPKLADAGVIEWDRESGEITKGPSFDEGRPVLKLLEEHDEDLPGSGHRE